MEVTAHTASMLFAMCGGGALLINAETFHSAAIDSKELPEWIYLAL